MKAYYTTEDISDIKALIKDEIKRSKELQEKSTHKDFVNDVHAREVKRLKVLLEFVKTKQIVTWYNKGCILINNKLIFSTRTNKWRVVGKQVWYHSKGPEDFIENYLKYDNTYFVQGE